MAAIKPFKMKRRKVVFRGYDRIYDPKDGISVNTIKQGWFISPHSSQMSIHDNPNLHSRIDAGVYKTLGIMKQVGRINRYKSLDLNALVGQLNRKAYNVR